MRNKYVWLLFVCAITFCYSAHSKTNKILHVRGSFLFEKDRLIINDTYIRDPVFVKYSKRGMYAKGVYIFGIDLGTLFNYGYDGPIIFDDTVGTKKSTFLANARLFKINTFSYLKINATLKCYYLGKYTIPIPLLLHHKNSHSQNLSYQSVPVYVIIAVRLEK